MEAALSESELLPEIIKDPTPDVNPETQCGSGITSSTWRRGTGTVLGKATLKSSDNPKFNEERIFRISCIPSDVKCSLLFILATIDLNKSKSSFFCVIKGYLSKCGIIYLEISSREETLKVKQFGPPLDIEPIPSKYS